MSGLPSSDEPCWLVAGDEVEEPIGASQRLPTTAVRPRAQGWKASFLAFLASVQTSQSIRQARSDPNFCSPHGRASRRSVVMVGVGARRPTRRRWASCGGRVVSRHCPNFGGFDKRLCCFMWQHCGWLVTAVAYAILRRELSFTSRFSSFPCLLLPSVLCAHSTACGITSVFCRARI